MTDALSTKYADLLAWRESGGVVKGDEALAMCAEFAAALTSLREERDEADRRAGAAARKIADLRDTEEKRQSWLWKAKEAEGYTDNTSFDDVWDAVRKQRDDARTESASLKERVRVLDDRWRAALSLLYEAENEINSCDSSAKGSYWYGNEIADRIGEFLKANRLNEPTRTEP